MARKIKRTMQWHSIILGEIHGTEVHVCEDAIQRPRPMTQCELSNLSKEAGCPVVVITDEIIEELREMSIETFLQHSTPVEVKEIPTNPDYAQHD